MTVTTRHRWRSAAILGIAVLASACQGAFLSKAKTAARSDTIVASLRAEPRSFNRYVTRDLTGDVICFLTQSALVRVNRINQQLEPELAERWQLLPDGLTYRLSLRRGVKFSDGQPFSAEDVVFSFKVLYRKRGEFPLADALWVGDKPLEIAAEDPETVTVRFPQAFGPGLRLLDGVPILPRHALEDAFSRGAFASAWGLSTPPAQLTGLGPFVLQQYQPGQRLIFERNPHYWQRGVNGTALPAARRVVLEIVQDQNAEQLRLESGDIDFTQSELRSADYGPLKRAEARGHLRVVDLGWGLDGDLLWFNLRPTTSPDTRSAWLRDVRFRRAVSHAINRQVFVDTVFLGAAVPAYGVVSPGNLTWHADVPAAMYDLAAARALLADLGLRSRRKTEVLENSDGVAARFSLLTQKGNTSLERGAEVIRQGLAELGVQVDIVPLEVGALVQRFSRGDYDAVYFRLVSSASDPSLNPEFWLSSGGAHVWNPEQAAPATTWEREIDGLMNQVSNSTDESRRRALFEEVQRIMARELPALCFAFPRLSFAMSTRISHATPAPVRPPVLWNPAVISVASTGQPSEEIPQ